MGNAEDFLVRLLLDVTGFLDSIAKVEGRLKSMSAESARIGSSLTKNLTMPIMAVGGAALKMASDFEAGMANVGTLLGEDGSARVKELEGDVKRLALESGKNLDDLTGGLYQVISAFGDSADSAGILEAAVKAGSAGLATTLDAVNLLSAVTKGYGDTSQETMMKVSDLAFQTVVLGQTTFPELAATIGRVTPLAATLGVEMEELFATFATLTGVTGGAAEVSTQYAGILRAMMKPTEDMSKAIDKLGYSGSKEMISTLGVTGALRALMKTTDGSEEAVGKLFGRAEALTAVFALAGGQAEIFDQKLAKMYESAGMTEEAFKIQTATMKVAMNQMKQAFAIMMVDLGDQLIPVLRDYLLPVLSQVIAKISDGIAWFRNLDEEQKKLIVTFIGLAAAIGPAFKILSLVLGVASKMFTPLGMIITVVGLLAAAWSAAGGNIGDVIEGLKERFQGFLDAIGGVVAWFRDVVLPSFVAGMTNSGEEAEGAWGKTFAALGALMQSLGLLVNEILLAIGRFWEEHGATITAIATATWETIKTVIDTTLAVIKGIIDFFVALFRGDWQGMKDAAIAIWQALWDGITGIVQGAWEIISGIVETIIGAVKNAVNWVLDLLGLSKESPEVTVKTNLEDLSDEQLLRAGLDPGAYAAATNNEEKANYGETSRLPFAEGGIVPGPMGRPVAATVHGGERILTPAQQRQEVEPRSIIINAYYQVSDKRTAEYANVDLVQRFRNLGGRGV